MGSPKLVRVAKIAAWMVVVAGLAVIAGWQFRIPVLKGQAFGTFVAPNTALSFVLAGGAILLRLSRRKFLDRLGLVLAVAVLLFAAATCLEYLFSVDLGIDPVFMAHRMADWSLPTPGRYTINTAFGLVCAGVSLLTMRRKSGLIAELFAGFVMLVSYLSLIALLFGASTLYDHVMAVHTAVLFLVLSIALLAGIKNHVLLGSLLCPFAGAIASRKMILLVAVLLPLFGGLELWAEQSGLVSVRLGTALSVIASVVVFTAVALRTAMVLNDMDRIRVEGEAALLKSTQLAAAGRMAASIAHEVNNPLESVTNLIFLLKSDGVPPEARKEYLEIAEKEIVRVAAIARRTLGFYREETKETEIDLRELVDGVLDIFSNKLASNIVVKRNYCDGARIIGRVGEIRQVVTNLVANAIDAVRHKGGTLEIELNSSGESIVLAVQDDGTGIGPENLKRIFEPFFTTKVATGTGLGLWVSRELVQKNHGSIHVTTSTGEKDHGTRFEVVLPAARARDVQVSSADTRL